MNIKSLVLGLAVVASLGSTAQANLVMNGSLEKAGDTSFYNWGPSNGLSAYPSNFIPNWDVHAVTSGAPNYNASYIYDNDLGVNLPPQMPPSYYCNPASGFVSGNCVNPDGVGHFINLDGDPSFPTAISQAISGLVPGQQYQLTFSWGAVERLMTLNGPTTNMFLDVSVGDQHFLTPSLNLPPLGFSGWFTTSDIFTWDGLDNTLTFLAHGLPGNLPPTINLDGISLNAVPEPPIWALLLAAGLGVMGVDSRRRRTAGC